MKTIDKLLNYQKDIANIQYTINLLNWQLKVSTPKKAEEDIINLITYYESKLFDLQTSSFYENILNDVINSNEFNKIEESEQRYILNLLRKYNENKKIPSDFYKEYVELKNKSNISWKQAKEENNYELFKPYLNSIIEMKKKYYKYIDNTTNNLYDVMLNHYESSITSNTIEKLFNELKERLLPLIPKENKQEEYQNEYTYTEKELIDCAKFLLEYIGFDMDKGMLGIYPHGFTEKMGPNDVRIAFNYTNNPFDFVTTIIHEGGHGIFEQNINKNLLRYENSSIDNLLALHESQSRFYENILARNINFWIPIYDKVKNMLHLNMPLDEFIKRLNTPKLNKIRTESDELTYCMHIILRYEIEKSIFNENINIDDLPSIWNKKMQEYLNITIEKDSEGLMQDVHWSEGEFGYFPDYLLGTIYDGMFIEAIEKDLGSIDEILKSGKIKDITNYLIKNIYQYGGAYTSTEIIKKLCHKEITIEPIAKYFEKKYTKTK